MEDKARKAISDLISMVTCSLIATALFYVARFVGVWGVIIFFILGAIMYVFTIVNGIKFLKSFSEWKKAYSDESSKNKTAD